MIPPVSHPDGSSVEAVASYVATCARGWEPGARLLGNARAEDIARMAEWTAAVAPLIERLRDVLGNEDAGPRTVQRSIDLLLVAAARGVP